MVMLFSLDETNQKIDDELNSQVIVLEAALKAWGFEPNSQLQVSISTNAAAPPTCMSAPNKGHSNTTLETPLKTCSPKSNIKDRDKLTWP
jgi:hypothetical protein